MSSTNERAKLTQRLQAGPEARSRFKENHIRELIASQIRMLRERNDLTQTELGERAGIRQSRISLLEDPDYSGIALRTLMKLSDAFDVGLVVRFAPFSDLVQFTTNLAPTDLAPPSFAEEQLPLDVIRPVDTRWFSAETHEIPCVPAVWGAASDYTVVVGGGNVTMGDPASETPEPDAIQKGVYAYADA